MPLSIDFGPCCVLQCMLKEYCSCRCVCMDIMELKATIHRCQCRASSALNDALLA
jgi:hypothetical protein